MWSEVGAVLIAAVDTMLTYAVSHEATWFSYKLRGGFALGVVMYMRASGLIIHHYEFVRFGCLVCHGYAVIGVIYYALFPGVFFVLFSNTHETASLIRLSAEIALLASFSYCVCCLYMRYFRDTVINRRLRANNATW